ncbi:MAG: DNA polymerase III subunit gamma/tau [Campylobacter sp.]|nr:DNA polymerase III subunit gamma/tau [Campylobacter sp.]
MKPLAIKYRPKTFSELVGQESVAKSLSNALDSGRLVHAYLFSGLRGSGKTSSARILAKSLLCDKGPTSTPCGECENCKMASEGRHMDIIEIDAASHRKIDDIRELIENIKYAPSMARYKIYIVDEVHMLTREAFNAFLKTLEEPPSYAKFILATTDPLKLPATVLSRTQHYRFRPIAKSAIISHLEFILQNESVDYEKEALEILARSGSGSLRDTLTLLDQAIIFSNSNITKSAVSDMLGLLDPAKIDEIFEVVLRQDKTAALDLIKELEIYDTEAVIDELIIYLKELFLKKDARISLLMYERFFRILSEAKILLLSNPDGGFVLSMLLFLMIEAVNLKSIDELIEQNSTEQNIQNLPQNSQTKLNPLETSKNISNNLEALPNQTKEQEVKIADIDRSNYDKFVANLYDRSYEVGEIFMKNVEFVEFRDNKLYLISKAKGSSKDTLRDASKAIMAVLRKTYNKTTKISIVQNEDSVDENQSPKITPEISPELAQNQPSSSDEISPTSVIDSVLDDISKMSQNRSQNKLDTNQVLSDIRQNISVVSDEEVVIKELTRLFGTPKKEQI